MTVRLSSMVGWGQQLVFVFVRTIEGIIIIKSEAALCEKSIALLTF